VPSESIQTPLLIPHFVTLLPYSKMYYIVVSLNPQTIPHKDKAKTGFLDVS
jgi:hypothetical protein